MKVSESKVLEMLKDKIVRKLWDAHASLPRYDLSDSHKVLEARQKSFELYAAARDAFLGIKKKIPKIGLQ